MNNEINKLREEDTDDPVTKKCFRDSLLREKRWLPYDEYYIGETDEKGRKNGMGDNHWSGAESLESYSGQMVRNAMHGLGEYRWRYKRPRSTSSTYEGYFFANHLHGYGEMSYPDGRTFTGLYYNDDRWGPGIERFANTKCNVGFWRGHQLVRLTWSPDGGSIAPDLTTGPLGSSYLDPFRIVFTEKVQIIGEINSAIDLLKQYGLDPVSSNKKWKKLYSEYCTDVNSIFCDKDVFYNSYYNGKIYTLKETVNFNFTTNQNEDDPDDGTEVKRYFAWNNNEMMIHMMNHCYQHHQQISKFGLNLMQITCDPRTSFPGAAGHEFDCRTVLLSSYLGNIVHVAKLINEENVYPDITDSKGNTALMYATCGDKVDIIHFLVEAGANVNAYNDYCCTPLGVALWRYICDANSIPPSQRVQALLPGLVKNAKEEKKEDISQTVGNPIEWKITRESTNSGNKQYKDDTDEDDNINKNRFNIVNSEYAEAINEIAPAAAQKTIEYLFTFTYMLLEIDAGIEDLIVKPGEAQRTIKVEKRPEGKSLIKTGASKILASKSVTSQPQILSTEAAITESLSRIQRTINQLLADGADPNLVQCPQPAIIFLLKSDCPELLRDIVNAGIDVNQRFPEFFDYTPLDIVMSYPFTSGSVEMIKILLENGADPNHKLKKLKTNEVTDEHKTLEPDEPSLLHAAIFRKIEKASDEIHRQDVLDLLLQYNADPACQYKGMSPILAAIMKNLELLDVFVRHPNVNLNCIISDERHTILMKIFTIEYFKTTIGINKLPTISNLLLYGADPLIESYNGEAKYGNVFDYALNNYKSLILLNQSTSFGKGTADSKKKEKKDDKKDKNKGKHETHTKTAKSEPVYSAECMEYKEALQYMQQCVQILYVRWIQAQLLKELVNLIYKIRHRHWSVIIKDHKNADNVGLWLSTIRALEIWDILGTTRRKIYQCDNVLKKMLCMVHFYQTRTRQDKQITRVTTEENDETEKYVTMLIKEHKVASKLAKELDAASKTAVKPYVKPELEVGADYKYNICFECCVRIDQEKVDQSDESEIINEAEEQIHCCEFCGLVTFCTFACLLKSLSKVNGHPCNAKLYHKYLYVEGEGTQE